MKHKIFISYHHANDQIYKEKLENIYCKWLNYCISKAVGDGDISDDLSDEKIREIIRDNYLKDSTVTVVLIGKDTWKRKHVDWEIYSSLYDGPKNKRNGLIGVLLPTYPDLIKNTYNPYTISPRLYDNIKSGYALLYTWENFINNAEKYIHEAYLRKLDNKYKTDLSRPRFLKNREGNRWW
jgi:hypothetical protein